METSTFLNIYKLTEIPGLESDNEKSCTDQNILKPEPNISEVASSITTSENKYSQSILKIQSRVHQCYSHHGERIRNTVYILLIVLYFAYFGYAMHYKFGDEPSIRLAWMTCFVIGVKLILTFNLWTRICVLCKPVLSVVPESRGPLISWIIGFAVLFGILIFVVVDVIVLSNNKYNLVSLSGIVLYTVLVFLFSAEPTKVQWRTVLWGINLQLLFALCVLRWSAGFTAVNWLANRFNNFLRYADNGSRFVFGESYVKHWFAFKAMPVVVFLSSIISVLYHLGVMPRVIHVIGWVLQKVMGTTAAESVAAAGNVFVGNTEAPLMILPMIRYMTRSELHCLMVGGFATIAGSAFGTLVILGAPPNHLIAASVMSAPAALALAKLSYPETEKSKTTVADIHSLQITKCKSIVEAASTGAIQSIKLVANMTVNILAFLGILQLMNETLAWMGNRVGILDPDLNFGLMCSYLLFPIALTMGVEIQHCRTVAEILGIKSFINTAMAYKMLGDLRQNKESFLSHIEGNGTYSYLGDDIILYHIDNENTTLVKGFLSDRSEAITTFSLCGFASIDSIGIMLGALTALVPERRHDLAALVVRAMIVGNISSFFTACVAGLLYQGD